MCVSRPYLGFCPNPKHFIVNSEQNFVKFAKKWEKCIEKWNFYIKYFDQIKCYALILQSGANLKVVCQKLLCLHWTYDSAFPWAAALS